MVTKVLAEHSVYANPFWILEMVHLEKKNICIMKII